jgi:flagellar hook-associated protein 3 FlgL
LVRITNQMMTSTVLRDLNTNLRNLVKYEEQGSTGKSVNRPSDDPIAYVKAMGYATSIAKTDVYTSNSKEALSFLKATDSTLADVSELIQTAYEQTVNGASDTNSDQSRQSIAEVIKQLQEQVVTLANSTYGSKYVFGGTNVSQEPLTTESGVQWNGNNGAISVEISSGVTIQMNSTMGDFFCLDNTQPGNENKTAGLYQLLGKIATDLENNDADALQNDITLIQNKLDVVNEERASVGGKMNRLELQQARLEDATTNLNSLLSSTEDADIAAVSMQLTVQKTVYNAALSIGAKIIQPTLVDFLD